MIPCSLALAALAAAWQTGVPATPAAKAPTGRILLVTRHCEKDSGGEARDPALSVAGRERAAALQRLLSSHTVDAAFSTEYARTRETAAIALGTTPVPESEGEAVGVGQGSRAEVHTVRAAQPELLFAAIDALGPGQTALVVGHSNTVPVILARYGAALRGADGAPIAMLPDDDYGALFVLTLPREGSGPAAARLVLRYGP